MEAAQQRDVLSAAISRKKPDPKIGETNIVIVPAFWQRPSVPRSFAAVTNK
jgi:hypothetical protein